MSYNSKIPVSAPDVEADVLGSSLLDREALYLILEKLDPQDFYAATEASPNRLVFTAMQELFRSGQEPDETSVGQYLRDQGQLEAIGGSGYFADLIHQAGSIGNIEAQCETLRNKRLRRKLIEGCRNVLSSAQDTTLETYKIIEQADSLIFNLLNNGNSTNTREAKEFIPEALEHLVSIQGAHNGVTGIRTGLDIDQITAGWQDGDFILVAARPSMGKTALTLQVVKQAAIDYGAAGIISLEMGSRSLASRLIISEAGIDGQRARKGQLNEEEISQIQEAAKKLINLGVIVDDTTVITPALLRAKARAMKHKYDISLLAVDYIQLLTSEKDIREQQVAEISRTCKEIAKDYDMPVLGLSQLNRSCEARHGINKRPQLSDLRESGALEQDSDVAIFLFRPEYYGINNYPETESGGWAGKSTENICEVIVAKQRNGPTGSRRILYENETMRFQNLASAEGMEEALQKAKKQKEKAPF